MPKIIDSHSHWMPPAIAAKTAFFKVGWSDIDRQLQVMAQNKIDCALLTYPTSDAHIQFSNEKEVCRIYNEEIAVAVEKHKPYFIGAGILPADDPAAMRAELKRIQALGLKVISLASSYDGKYLDDEIFTPIFEAAQRQHMPIFVHSQIIRPIGEERVKDPLLSPVIEYVFDVSMCIGKMMMAGIFARFPDVKFIFVHYGGVLTLLKERFDTTYAMLRGRNFVKDLGKFPSEFFKNIYFDTSGSKSAASLKLALELTDASHILWGSDYPANQRIQESMSFLESTGLSAQEKSLILGGNFSRLLAE